jgi:hypothetical protein
MGSMQEQLKKLTTQARSRSTGSPPSGQAIGPRTDGSSRTDDEWKLGVTPLGEKYRGAAAGTLLKTQPNKEAGRGATGLANSASPGTSLPARRLAVTPKRSDESPRSPERHGIPSNSIGHKTRRPTTVGELSLPNRLLNLTEPTHFKQPEPWIDTGQFVQPPGGGSGKNLSVHIGVDFGTAYTKLAIKLAGTVIAVPWSGLCASPARFFLPGEISRCADGSVLLGRAPVALETRGGIKQPFLGSQPSLEDRVAATAFLAWVFRYARAWLYKHRGGLLRGRKLAWNVAVGCPTKAIEDQPLVQTYLHLAAAAWLLSRWALPIGFDSAQKAIEVARPDPDSVQLDSLAVVPEFVAQIAGYARSSQRQRGLHFLVDIGAGTVDLAMFNVERDLTDESRDHYPILERSVEFLGTHFLMSARAKATDGALQWADRGRVPDLATLVANYPDHATAIRAADERFGEHVKHRVERVLKKTHGKRSPHSDVWQHGLPVFLAGGGSNCDLYRNAVQQACSACGVKPILLPLQVSDRVDCAGIELSDVHRLSVALGLTDDASLLAKITASKEIPDLVLRGRRASMPDRDELYPK